MCSDSTLDKIEDAEQLSTELIARVNDSDFYRNILNRVYVYLQGLENCCENVQLSEYVPEEPDWILNGRIKWLKRYTLFSDYSYTLFMTSFYPL